MFLVSLKQMVWWWLAGIPQSYYKRKDVKQKANLLGIFKPLKNAGCEIFLLRKKNGEKWFANEWFILQ